MKTATKKAPILNFLLINLAIFMIAVQIYFFKTPNGFAFGGVSGLSLVLSRITAVSAPFLTQATYMLFINI